MHPIETGNIVMMILGALLVGSGPVIIYRTVRGWIKNRSQIDAKVLLSDGLNLLIAVVFFVAGILFIVNNLRGNPLHFKA
jgi:hypothetical protein